MTRPYSDCLKSPRSRSATDQMKADRLGVAVAAARSGAGPVPAVITLAITTGLRIGEGGRLPVCNVEAHPDTRETRGSGYGLAQSPTAPRKRKSREPEWSSRPLAPADSYNTSSWGETRTPDLTIMRDPTQSANVLYNKHFADPLPATSS